MGYIVCCFGYDLAFRKLDLVIMLDCVDFFMVILNPQC